MEIKITEDWVLTHPHARAKNGYKHRFGHVLVIGGSPGFCGSVLLTAEAALRSGCGIVTVLANEAVQQALLVRVPEAMTVEWAAWRSIDFSKFQSIAIGPGLGQGTEALEILAYILNHFQGALVIDADALNLMAFNPNLFDLLTDLTILTPHLGEFARIEGSSFDKLPTEHALARAKAWITKRAGVLVLKGALSHVLRSDGKCYVNTTGNDGMATAGSGDVLTGIIAGIAAQGYSSDDAACLGVYLHGLAGDTYAQKKSKASLLASDIIEHLGNTKLLD
jgi:NAD(P)H-hydrate epimerase